MQTKTLRRVLREYIRSRFTWRKVGKGGILQFLARPERAIRDKSWARNELRRRRKVERQNRKAGRQHG